MIYQINNPAEGVINYVCPDQATIEQGQSMGYTGVFNIGTQSDANAILIQNQQAILTNNVNLFSVNKDIDLDPIQTTWLPCDLNTELPNIDQDYNIFNVVNGYYTLATGLDNAKTLLEETKQNYLTFIACDSVISFENWLPIPKPPTTTGTQTF